MEKHINVVAALHIGFSILGIIIGGIVFVVLYFVRDISGDPDAEMVLTIIANVMVIFVIIFSLPGIIAGIGLFKRKEWARILTLIISVLDLFNIPFGTAVGVYSIWALVQPEVVAQFKNTEPVSQ
jgi:Ni,Fe-hydrogenase I cytochrome b subunit